MCRAASTPTGNPTPNSGAAAPPPAHRLGEALTARAAATVTLRARVALRVPAWTLIGQIPHGRLVAPAAAQRRAESTLPSGSRAPGAGRHRDAAGPSCARRRVTLTTRPPTADQDRPRCPGFVVMANGANVVILNGGQTGVQLRSLRMQVRPWSYSDSGRNADNRTLRRSDAASARDLMFRARWWEREERV